MTPVDGIGMLPIRVVESLGPLDVTEGLGDLGGYYVVTHARSELKLPGAFKTKEKARAFAKRALLLADFSQPVEQLRKDRVCCKFVDLVAEMSDVAFRHDRARCGSDGRGWTNFRRPDA